MIIKNEIPDISLIIPAYNEEDFLPNTLDSVVRDQEVFEGSLEVIVVDNASTDNTASIASDYGYQTVFEEERNIARVRNKGAAYANGKYLIFLDADTLLPKGLLDRVNKIMSSGNYIGGGTHLKFDSHWGLQLVAAVVNAIYSTFKTASGACMFNDHKVFSELGGFDEQNFYGEDMVFQSLLKRKGKQEGKKFAVVSDLKAITSGRKIEQHGWWGCFQTYVSSGVSQKSFYSLFGKSYTKKDTPSNAKYWYK